MIIVKQQTVLIENVQPQGSTKILVNKYVHAYTLAHIP
jgi:hypothetical protein